MLGILQNQYSRRMYIVFYTIYSNYLFIKTHKYV